jgi:two-component system, cell cycle sensor histidine kinase and response regulator CckA
LSEPGQGTTFKIYLPRHTSPTELLSKEETEQMTEHGHETILLIEDELMILNMTAAILKQHGYNVLPAATPGEAIQLAGEHAGQSIC